MSDIARKICQHFDLAEEAFLEPMSEIVQTETRALLEENVKLAAEVARLRDMLGKTTRYLPQYKNKLDAAFGGSTDDTLIFPEVLDALAQPTNTTGLLELAVAAKDFIEITERREFCAYATLCREEDKEVDRCYGCNLMDKVEALPQELKNLLERI